MGKEFFVAFASRLDEHALMDTVRRMNAVSAFSRNSLGLTVSARYGIVRGKRGVWIKNTGNDTCYTILQHKFFMESNDDDGRVFFYDKELKPLAPNESLMVSEPKISIVP